MAFNQSFRRRLGRPACCLHIINNSEWKISKIGGTACWICVDELNSHILDLPINEKLALYKNNGTKQVLQIIRWEEKANGERCDHLRNKSRPYHILCAEFDKSKLHVSSITPELLKLSSGRNVRVSDRSCPRVQIIDIFIVLP